MMLARFPNNGVYVPIRETKIILLYRDWPKGREEKTKYRIVVPERACHTYMFVYLFSFLFLANHVRKR